jgi:hypothetical protein
VLFDRGWLQMQAESFGLVVTDVTPPTVRGHQWIVQMQTRASGAASAEWPIDSAPLGTVVPPLGSDSPHLIR